MSYVRILTSLPSSIVTNQTTRTAYVVVLGLKIKEQLTLIDCIKSSQMLANSPLLILIALCDLAIATPIRYVHLQLHVQTGSDRFMDNFKGKPRQPRIQMLYTLVSATYLSSMAAALAATVVTQRRLVKFLAKQVDTSLRESAELSQSLVVFRERLESVDQTLQSVLQQTMWEREATKGQSQMLFRLIGRAENKWSKKFAERTCKDSIRMSTISGVTLFFLSGTFLRRTWPYWVVTTVFTALVFSV
ncbi:hypothetical protein BCR34DRAFT_590866 [Clohesyomyces aquaticus]|uniref:Uncharacterized protein n=1 Tax=Clohesyomyces aquaticus TaxID=1231657 RepID=A0A1Y1Z5N5_9PLEO|nr:hypothetical protein BCR34DRAFT_590866 [Clohesyomyces aquaticus]